MMRQREYFRYSCDDAFEVLQMPYHGCDISFLIFLPRKKCGLNEAMIGFDGAYLLTILDRCRSTNLEVC